MNREVYIVVVDLGETIETAGIFTEEAIAEINVKKLRKLFYTADYKKIELDRFYVEEDRIILDAEDVD